MVQESISVYISVFVHATITNITSRYVHIFQGSFTYLLKSKKANIEFILASYSRHPLFHRNVRKRVLQPFAVGESQWTPSLRDSSISGRPSPHPHEIADLRPNFETCNFYCCGCKYYSEH